MKFISLGTLSVLILFIPASYATIIDVPDDYLTIQAAINAAGTGDSVIVQPGSYIECITFGNHNITLGSLYLTTGDTSYISSTAIQYDESRLPVVTVTNGLDSSTVIKGLTIRDARDGGIRIVDASPTVTCNLITANKSYRDGAGMYCENGSPTISYNTFTDNMAGFQTGLGNGGGIFCYNQGSPVIEHNLFNGNSATGGAAVALAEGVAVSITDNDFIDNHADVGGAIFIYSSSRVNLEDNLIHGNYADWFGGGIYCYRSMVAMESNLIAANRADETAGACIFCDSDVRMTRLTIADNVAGDSVGGMWYDSSNIRMSNSIQWGNSSPRYNEIFVAGGEVIIEYTDIAIDLDTLGNIKLDPLFIDPNDGDYHLQPGSPCIDSGNPASPLDPDGTCCDMGMYYFDQLADIDDNAPLPVVISLQQNYPNPFNGRTIIAYSLPEPGFITIDVYDILGRKLETIAGGYNQAGDYSLIYDPAELVSGVYFYRLTAGNSSISRKMTICK